ncbi:hypothetical protein GQ53DRAFT_639311, partial [Thozetella sp. PMI_491]
LLRVGANPAKKIRKDRLVLYLAITKGYKDITKVLLNLSSIKTDRKDNNK